MTAWGPCGTAAPSRRCYPNGKRRPLDVCNRSAGHEGPHRVTDGRTFAVVVEWPQDVRKAG